MTGYILAALIGYFAAKHDCVSSFAKGFKEGWKED